MCFYAQIEKTWPDSQSDYKDSEFRKPKNGVDVLKGLWFRQTLYNKGDIT